MRHVKWAVPAVAAVVVLALLLLPGHLGLPPLVSADLFVQPVGDDPPTSPLQDWLVRNVAKSPNGAPLASFAIYAEPLGPYAYKLRTAFWHDESYQMDSMSVTFRIPYSTGELALVTPQGSPWNNPQFRRDPSTGDVTFSVDQLGFMGTGSVFNEFVFVGFAQPGDEDVDFTVEADFTMSRKGILQFVGNRAHTEIEVNLPVK